MRSPMTPVWTQIVYGERRYPSIPGQLTSVSAPRPRPRQPVTSQNPVLRLRTIQIFFLTSQFGQRTTTQSFMFDFMCFANPGNTVLLEATVSNSHLGEVQGVHLGCFIFNYWTYSFINPYTYRIHFNQVPLSLLSSFLSPPICYLTLTPLCFRL